MVDLATLNTLFGDELMASDMNRASKGDVSATNQALEGPGGPFDDMIPAEILGSDGSVEAAALSPGEFVLSQPVVEFLGDGDVNFGADLLGIMQNVPEALTEIKDVLKKYAAG